MAGHGLIPLKKKAKMGYCEVDTGQKKRETSGTLRS